MITSSVIFSARAAAYIARYRPMLLYLSVCLSVTPVDHSETINVGPAIASGGPVLTAHDS